MNMAQNCLFCKIAAGQIPVVKIFEDEALLGFLDIGPLSDGHTLVIPKQHFERLHDCPGEVLANICRRIGTIAKAVICAVNCDDYNVLCNNGRAAGQLINHLHFHIIPRKTGDGLFNNWPAYKYKEGRCEAIADEIRKNL
ncbi:MAG: HIT family protein [Sedimentisphaerales bacterium]|nr:HIT family protein [Sedimentisphaerales bacterium]